MADEKKQADLRYDAALHADRVMNEMREALRAGEHARAEHLLGLAKDAYDAIRSLKDST
jgi:hypothetical protein